MLASGFVRAITRTFIGWISKLFDSDVGFVRAITRTFIGWISKLFDSDVVLEEKKCLLQLEVG